MQSSLSSISYRLISSSSDQYDRPLSQQIESAEPILSKNDSSITRCSDKQMIIRHMTTIVIAEKVYLAHSIMSIFLCLAILGGLCSNIYESTPETIQAERIIYRFPELSIKFNVHLAALLQNLMGVYLLTQIVAKDRCLFEAMKRLLSRDSTQTTLPPPPLLSRIVNRALDQFKKAKAKLYSSMKYTQSHIPHNNQETKDLLAFETEADLLNKKIIKQRDDLAEQAQLEFPDHPIKSEITLYNVMERATETSYFGRKLLVSFASVAMFVINLIAIVSSTDELQVDPELQVLLLVILGLPAIMLILPFGFHAAQVASSVLFLVGYVLSILFRMTYSVIIAEIEHQIRKRKIKQSSLKKHSHLKGTTCSICIFEFDSPEDSISILSCNHTFHYECIRLWISNKEDCPLCRAII